MRNKKNKIILLSVFLVVLIALGTFVILNNISDKENNPKPDDKTFSESQTNDENNKDNGKSGKVSADDEYKKSGAFYYTEEFITESLHGGGSFNNIFKINGEFAVYKDRYLQNVKTKENIVKLPEGIGFNFAVNEEGFYDVGYDKDTKKIMFNSFDFEGTKKESIELKDFKGLIVDDSYIWSSDVKVTKNYLYFLARNNKGDDILHIYTKTGELKNSYDGVNCFDVDSSENVCMTVSFVMKDKNDEPHMVYMVNSETGEEIFKNTSYFLHKICFSEDESFIYGLDGKKGKINMHSVVNGYSLKPVFEFGIDSTYLIDDYIVDNMLIGKDDEIILSM